MTAERVGPAGLSPLEVAREFASMARSLLAAQDVGTTLERICSLAATQIEGCEAAGISLVRGGRITTRGATDGISLAVDRIQYELDEGPCLDAIRVDEVVQADDLSVDGRWPRFGATAVAETGVRSMLSLRLFDGSFIHGALNLYASRPLAFDGGTDAAGWGAVYATHASVALAGARKASNLREALESRETISVAVGIIMGRQGVGRQAAFDVLRRASQRTNVKLRTVAEQVAGGGDVLGVADDGGGPPPTG